MLHQSDGADSNAELSVWLAKGDHDWMSALARLKWLARVGSEPPSKVEADIEVILAG